MIEPLLLTTTRVSTFDNNRPLTAASGFFFERDGHLFLVTSRPPFHLSPFVSARSSRSDSVPDTL